MDYKKLIIEMLDKANKKQLFFIYKFLQLYFSQRAYFGSLCLTRVSAMFARISHSFTDSFDNAEDSLST